VLIELLGHLINSFEFVPPRRKVFPAGSLSGAQWGIVENNNSAAVVIDHWVGLVEGAWDVNRGNTALACTAPLGTTPPGSPMV
jgi:hypothetical protein